jgi:tetratricopeptide (TPR) repeat protein
MIESSTRVLIPLPRMRQGRYRRCADLWGEGFIVRVATCGFFLVLLGGCVSAVGRQTRELTEDGVRLFKAGRYKEASQTFEAALALSPGEPALLYDLGECYERSGNVVRAEQLYNDCIFREPDHPECRHALCVLLVKQKRQGEARQMVETWLKQSPSCASAYAEDGWLWHQAGDLPKAHSRFQDALKFDPVNRRALLELGQLFEETNRPDRALVMYERADRAYPNHPDIKPHLDALRNANVPRPHPE